MSLLVANVFTPCGISLGAIHKVHTKVGEGVSHGESVWVRTREGGSSLVSMYAF